MRRLPNAPTVTSELYFNARLSNKGHRAGEVQGLSHPLAKRTERAAGLGLRLRPRTVKHRGDPNLGRDYPMTRYVPELAGSWSQLNRLMATIR